MKAYIINLEKRPDRLNDLNIPFEWERFIAIDGLELTKSIPNIPRLIRGHIGCVESHKKLLSYVKQLNLDYYIIFEDDVELCNNFEISLKKAIDELPFDWDLLYIGGWNLGEIKKYSEHLNIAEKVYTTHAYMIRNKFIDVVLQLLSNQNINNYNPNECWKIDLLFSQVLTKGKCFICSPLLAWQRSGFSDIVGKITDNTHLKNNIIDDIH